MTFRIVSKPWGQSVPLGAANTPESPSGAWHAGYALDDSANVAFLAVRLQVHGDLGLQRRHEHPAGFLAGDLVE